MDSLMIEVDESPQPAESTAGTSARAVDVPLTNRERRGIIAVSDALVGGLACAIAFTIHPGHLHHLPLFEPFFFAAMWVVSLFITDGYGFLIPTSRTSSAIAVLRALPVALAFAIADFFFRPYVLNRTVIVLALGIGALLLILVRITAARLLLRESFAVRAVVLSDREPQPEFLAALQAARFECQVTATLIKSPESAVANGSLLTDVTNQLAAGRAHQLIVTNNELRLVPGLAEECVTKGVRVVSGAELVERYMGYVPLEAVDVHWYLSLPESDLLARPYALGRRIMDLLLTVVASPLCLLLPLLALGVRLDSPGPIFIRQRRVGENGHQFDVIKLRTMNKDAESDGPQLTAPDDPRITRFGRFLRLTRLDEIPQLLNIFRGDMSFIGPRPERPEFVEQFERQIPHFRSRLLVKPGLTGWAQVKSGYASTTPEIKRKLEYDLYYIKNRSFRLDLQILGITFLTVLGRGGR